MDAKTANGWVREGMWVGGGVVCCRDPANLAQNLSPDTENLKNKDLMLGLDTGSMEILCHFIDFYAARRKMQVSASSCQG